MDDITLTQIKTNEKGESIYRVTESQNIEVLVT